MTSIHKIVAENDAASMVPVRAYGEIFGETYPKPNWEWSVFGGDIYVVRAYMEVPLWRRMLTRILLGSTWKKL